ncbi:hypothetical protein LEP1GSC005_0094 [Leptospira santarosai str. ST188]|nr:hypothetical protein LEP1GSC005_0094 [Leptospira santarosai str. ST188]
MLELFLNWWKESDSIPSDEILSQVSRVTLLFLFSKIL